MRVLAHIHTFNDAAVIGQALRSLLQQTRPPDAIVIVDNASTDDSLARSFPPGVAVIRHATNLGTSGTVISGMTYAMEHGFDWIWIFDADSVPAPDALERLLAFYAELPAAAQEQVGFIGCWPVGTDGEVKERPIRFTGRGIEYLMPQAGLRHTRCDCTLWSGSLYRLAAVAKIGLPSADYVLDVAELEYGYRARQRGFTSYIVHDVEIRHDVGRLPGAAPRRYRCGPLEVTLYELSPIRCYYSMRNWIYFWLYQSKPRRLRHIVRSLLRSLAFTTSFAIRPATHRRQLIACLRGVWDGVAMRMERRH